MVNHDIYRCGLLDQQQSPEDAAGNLRMLRLPHWVPVSRSNRVSIATSSPCWPPFWASSPMVPWNNCSVTLWETLFSAWTMAIHSTLSFESYSSSLQWQPPVFWWTRHEVSTDVIVMGVCRHKQNPRSQFHGRFSSQISWKRPTLTQWRMRASWHAILSRCMVSSCCRAPNCPKEVFHRFPFCLAISAGQIFATLAVWIRPGGLFAYFLRHSLCLGSFVFTGFRACGVVCDVSSRHRFCR